MDSTKQASRKHTSKCGQVGKGSNLTNCVITKANFIAVLKMGGAKLKCDQEVRVLSGKKLQEEGERDYKAGRYMFGNMIFGADYFYMLNANIAAQQKKLKIAKPKG